jgi:dGTP triphosphohydrolase
MPPKREDRRSGDKHHDQRNAFQRDRDRILAPGLSPPRRREEIRQTQGDIAPPGCARWVADAFASMTDQQASRLGQRLTDLAQGSALNPVIS